MSDIDQAGPSEQQLAERAKRADRATRGALAANLCLEAIVVLLVPRTLAQTYGLGSGRAVTLIALAVVMILVAFVQRRSWGIGAGSVMQLPFMAVTVWIPVFAVLGAIFWTIWLYVLNIRRELVGTPGGWAMLVS